MPLHITKDDAVLGLILVAITGGTESVLLFITVLTFLTDFPSQKKGRP